MATTANRRGAAMAGAAARAGADRIFMMGYDYRVTGSEPGASSPLGRRDGSEKTLHWSLDLYLDAGVPPERTILGLPLYGVVWPVAGPEIGALSTGRGDFWVPRRNLATLESPDTQAAYDPVEDVEVLVVPDGDGWQAVYYDSPAEPHAEAGAGRPARTGGRRVLGGRLRAGAAGVHGPDPDVPGGPAGRPGGLIRPRGSLPDVHAGDPARRQGRRQPVEVVRAGPDRGDLERTPRHGLDEVHPDGPVVAAAERDVAAAKLRRMPIALIHVNGPSIRYRAMFATGVRMRAGPNRISSSSPTSA